MGFHRQPQPATLDRATLHDLIEERLAELMEPHDPFLIEGACPQSQGGHQAISSCGDVVCLHCSKVFWQ